jgi:sigma-B regulation protein RsbU (phosphoserine phosphatase)
VSQSNIPRRLPYIILVTLLIVIGGIEVTSFRQLWETTIHPVNLAQYPLAVAYFSDRVVWVPPEAAEAGLRQRDRILEVAGKPYLGSAVLDRELEHLKAGDTLVLRVASEGQSPEKTVSIRLRPAASQPWSVRAATVMIKVVTPAFCLLLGFAVCFLRPRDPLAWILLGMMIGFACLSPTDTGSWPDGERQAGIIFLQTGVVCWPIFMLLFGVYFPERAELDRRHPWGKWLIIAPLLILAVLDSASGLAQSESFHRGLRLQQFLDHMDVVHPLLAMTGVSSFFWLLAFKGRVTQSPDGRRRLQLLLTGAQVSLTPIGVLFCFVAFGHRSFSSMPVWIVIPSFLLLFVFPATLGYVIVVHRALDVRVVARQSLQYALARGGVRLLQAGIGLGVLLLAVQFADDPTVRRPVKVAYIAFGLVVVVRIRGGADLLHRWLDRRFFREAVDTEKVLGELSEKVRGMVETGPLLEVVSQSLSHSLHVKHVAVLLDEQHAFSPAYTLGFDHPPLTELSESSLVTRRVVESGPARVYLDDVDSWVHDESDRAVLRTLDSQLLLPLVVRGQLLGIVSLGPKQSEEPYSASDLRLLESVAAQTGLALANAKLTAAVAAEVAQRERLNREMEIAREVQERLFPQNMPLVPGLDYCGHCRPALGVGGDYYDFLGLPDSELGIAIGDVSGKGIAAALLMASLQASLRGQTLREKGEIGAELATIMRHVNRLVYDASSSNRYATFFYAQYEPVSRRLSYVNAGHNPPVVLRAGEAIRLEAGGAVVGLLPDFPYGEGSIQLQLGDVLVAFTDGISESMNPEDEEWGEDAMIAAARDCAGLTARETLDHLMAGADAFARGAKQHDDMTLVIARVVAV